MNSLTQNLHTILSGLMTLFTLLSALSCSGQASPPNILWITCEDIGPAWGCYGDDQAATPHIDQIAQQGFIFRQAFSNAPICAPARSTLITGLYASSLGTQHLRSEIPVPADLKTLPELLKRGDYFTTNNAKTDYNFSAEGRWDENGREAHWRNRTPGQPFFSVFNFGITHEGHANRFQKTDVADLEELHDPARMTLPPYWPQTDTFKNILAHQYDLITVFDREVKKLMDQLAEDGLRENTIIFIFSDHGFGLPRGKRWLYDSGLRVPFVLFLPQKYRVKYPRLNTHEIHDLVAFVDFAPTVLDLAGIEIPAVMQGKSFVNRKVPPKSTIFGYRDRADDVYDMSRSIYDGQYMYIRNFMPHKPYIREAVIFNKDKRSYDELWRLKATGDLNPEVRKMFSPKDPEELYDLQADPHQQRNLIHEANRPDVVSSLGQKLKSLMLSTYDTGLLNEAEMLRRSGSQSVFEMMRSPKGPALDAVWEAANLVGKGEVTQVRRSLSHDESAVRYWALMAIDAMVPPPANLKARLDACLKDPSLTNRLLAAEILVKNFGDKKALELLAEALQTEKGPSLLQAAISVREIGEQAQPLLGIISDKVYPRISGEIWGRYRSWMYPMFIGMALDQIYVNCGETLE